MASVSNSSSLSPQIQIKEGRMILERAVTNSQGVAYDISISFKSNGVDVGPPMGLLPSSAMEIQNLAKRILASLPRQDVYNDNLEQLGFLIENGASGSNLKTAILIADAGESVLNAWKEGKLEKITRKETDNISLQSDSTMYENQKKITTVHSGLKHLRSLFEGERFVALPTSSKPVPDLTISFPPSHVEPISTPPVILPPPTASTRKMRKKPDYLLFHTAGGDRRKTLMEDVWNEFRRENLEFNEIEWKQLLQEAPLDRKTGIALQGLFRDKAKLNQLYEKFRAISDTLYDTVLQDIKDGKKFKGYLPAMQPGFSKELLKQEFLDELERRWRPV